jgi:hypothetical protein
MLTTTESALAGIALGGIISLLTGWIASHSQWTREERRRILDRRAALYEETLVAMDRMQRTWYRIRRAGQGGAHPDEFPDEQEEDERSAWNARINLYASKEVRALWDAWTNTLVVAAQGERKEREALVGRMRAEVGRS